MNKRDPKKYPFGCKCQTLHHRIAGDGCDECQPQENAFAYFLRSVYKEINKGQDMPTRWQLNKNWYTWERISKEVLKRPEATIYKWLSGNFTPDQAIQKDVKSKLNKLAREVRKLRE